MNSKINKLGYVLFLFISIFSYGQNMERKDITLTILKDSIENNSLITIEFYNHSDIDYYLPLDVSMDRYLGFNSFYNSNNHFSLNEVWYDRNLKKGIEIAIETMDCMDTSQTFFSYEALLNEKNTMNIDILVLKSNRYRRMRVPIVFVKRYCGDCTLYYQETEYMFNYFQLNYQVTYERMEQIREDKKYYAREYLEDKGYQLYTKKIESNIVPFKISEKMKAFMNDYPSYGKDFLEIETE
ncbi:hypothetical protein [Myroides odoratus]|uniref:hypothetical protein n=1 Tax=Myroides odoratus TaxID=256 RepID=UPI0033427F4D